jgi:hypothetical protein
MRLPDMAEYPQKKAIVTLMEKRLAAALAADGRTLPSLSSEERLRALRIAAEEWQNDFRQDQGVKQPGAKDHPSITREEDFARLRRLPSPHCRGVGLDLGVSAL